MTDTDSTITGDFEFLLNSDVTENVLYFCSVLFSSFAYLMIFFQVVLIPYQVALMPSYWGPTWLYALVYLFLNMEYFLWPLEMTTFLMRPSEDKAYIVD